jgi:hypothetical protein
MTLEISAQNLVFWIATPPVGAREDVVFFSFTALPTVVNLFQDLRDAAMIPHQVRD